MRRIASILACAVIAIAGGLGLAAPSQAAVTCGWHSGHIGDSSNCDNLPVAECANWRIARTTPIGPGIAVDLYYSPTCRTVAGSVRATVGDLYTENCYVKVHRNSDNEVLYAGVEQRSRNPNFYVGTTNMLYDADVTSYAWSHCELSNGAVYRGGTPSY
ncbi:hypothetical protein ACTMTJ_20650 [Phytohabitans sp. LJ34]|uniref:hypothetical protein n=1 Tax=Phytohabitans sp. LJ34 TaxID=3452217 RepID=UPI003F88D4E1